MKRRIAIVDYGVGNLFSAGQACRRAGLEVVLTSRPDEVLAADSVLLPGMGAFGNAMDALRALGLVSVLQTVAARGTPLVGICLGMQLLMSESEEFGRHEGLGIIPGVTVKFVRPVSADGVVLKVPHVGWNRIHPPAGTSWHGTPLSGLKDGAFMYFVHSYRVQPEDPRVVLATSRYGHVDFCSVLRRGNVFGCQFHPERSGPAGLHIYEKLAEIVGRMPVNGSSPQVEA